MNSIKHGDVIKIRANGTTKNKAQPAYHLGVVVSADVINDNLNTVIVCPLIRAEEVNASRLGVTFVPGRVVGAEADHLVFSLQIKTVPKHRIAQRLSTLPPAYMKQVRDSLQAVLNLG